MKELVKNTVSQIKLSDASKNKILSAVKENRTSGKTKKPIIKYVSFAAVLCVLIASASVCAVYFNNKPIMSDQKCRPEPSVPQISEDITEGGTKIYVGANIGESSENDYAASEEAQDIISEQSTSEKYETSVSSEASYAPESSDKSHTEQIGTDEKQLPKSSDNINETSPEMMYRNMNGIYIENSLYNEINLDNRKILYYIKVFAYDSEAINDYIYQGNRYSDVMAKLEDAHIRYEELGILIEQNSTSETDPDEGNSTPAYDPNNNNKLQNYTGEYYNTDIKTLINEHKELETIIEELQQKLSEIIVAYNTEFAEKAKDEFIRCGVKTAEVKNDMCYITASADDIKSLKIESKDKYALIEDNSAYTDRIILE